MQKNLIITLILSVVVAIFAILNARAIPINLIFVRFNVSAALVILISTSIGAIIAYLLDAVTKFKLRRQIKELEKSAASLKYELENLKEKNAELEDRLQNKKAAELEDAK